MDELVYGLKVLKKKSETADTVTLTFEIGEELEKQFEYLPGQFITLHVMRDKKLYKRSYSLSSSPGETDFNITVKKIPGGAISGFLTDDLEVGKIIPSTPPAGVFKYSSSLIKSNSLCLIGAGSGITPLFSIMKVALKDNKNVHLIYCNRNESCIIFKDEIEALKKEYPNQLSMTDIFTQPEPNWEGISGRPNKDTFETILKKKNMDKDAHFYLCGPVQFMDEARASITNLGFDRKQIHSEDFNPIVADSSEHEDTDTVYIGDISTKSEPGTTVNFVLNDESFSLEIDNTKSLLDNLIEQDKNPPYSCMDGACMACMAKITDGLIVQDELGVLSEDSIEDKEILTCKATLASKTATINFDDLF